MEAQLINKFGPSLKGKDTILTEFQTLMSIYGFSIHEIYVKWEQFAFQNKSAKFEETFIEKFKTFLHQQIEKKNNTSFSVMNNSANTSLNNVSDTSINFNKTNILSTLKRPMQQNKKQANSMFGNQNSSPQAIKKRRVLMNTSSPVLSTIPSQSAVDSIKDEDISNDDLDDSFQINEMSQGNVGNTSFIPQTDDSFDDTKDFKTPFMKDSETKPLLQKNKSKKVSGSISKTLNSNIDVCLEANDEDKLRIVPYFDAEKYKFRTMRQNTVDIADYLDDQIETFIEIVKAKYENVEVGDPTLQSQSEIICCGRIVPDNTNISTENNLNSESIALETSRMIGIGKRVKLELKDLKNQSFFQGQIVALRGKNATGEYFHVDEVLELPYLGGAVTSKDELHEFNENMNNNDMKILVAAGPFTSQTMLDFSELTEFVEKVNTVYKPHCLVLLGPFIDISNELIVKGDIPTFPGLASQPKTLDDLFIKVVSPILKKICPSVQVIVVPNVNDTAINHCSYPQPPIDRKQMQLVTPAKNIKCFPNPATFQANEMFVGVSNIDFFKNCKDIFVGGDMLLTNRFERLSRYILQQRRYFPMFPSSWNQSVMNIVNKKKASIFGADNAASVELPAKNNDPPSVDVAYSGLSEFVSGIIPDLLILPSDLNPFANIVDNVIVVNPGNFISRMTGQTGSFIQITVKAPNTESLSRETGNTDEEMYFHDIWQRARIDIVNV